jgi:hypothetical protein
LNERWWAAVSTSTEVDFRHHMEELKRINVNTFEYLDKIDHSVWSRAWFSEYPKCDILVNNIFECFNSYILKARDNLILTMLEMIRKHLMRMYQLKGDSIRSLKGKLCPRIVEKLETIGEEAIDYLSHFVGDGLFEVEQGCRQYIVDLRKWTSRCKKWEMTGIPCAHAFSVILYHGGKPEDYVNNYYSLEMYKNQA